MYRIQNARFRITAFRHPENGNYFLSFEVRSGDGNWRKVLGTGIESTPNIWSPEPRQICRDPVIEWHGNRKKLETAAGFFEECTIVEDGGALALNGKAGPHELAERVTLADNTHIHMHVTDRVAEGGSVGKLFSTFYFLPDNHAQRRSEPLDFAWIPNLHWNHDDVCADHAFRSPTVMLLSGGLYAALIPDLDVLSRNRPAIRHALDYRAPGLQAPGEDAVESEVPRFSYGFCSWQAYGATYFRHDPTDCDPVDAGELSYAFDLLLGESSDPENVVGKVTSFLWEKYGHSQFDDVRPQVLPFEEYGRKYAYEFELPRTVKQTVIDGAVCSGIANPYRRGANFHAWENDIQVAFGICHYAEKWQRKDLRDYSDGILRLLLNAPANHGAFPCIYNFEREAYEGSLWWTAKAADPYEGFDAAAMGVSAWWLLYRKEHFNETAGAGNNPAIGSRITAYAQFLKSAQLPSGAVPAYYFSDLSPAKQLKESATTAISGSVLAKAALITGDEGLMAAALAAGKFMDDIIVPKLDFGDFETFYSSSPKPLHWIDIFSGIRPQNTLSLQWACDQFLALFRLTDDSYWLDRGEFLLALLSLYQQVWNPPHVDAYLFGGFGVMNTDHEWNDGRQARFVPTYADYYLATGKIEYLERAVAACRASFALMDISENHLNEINSLVMPQGPGEGYAGESIIFSNPDEEPRAGWTGFTWSAGGALAASAYLERLFGTVWIDAEKKKAVPIDGLTVDDVAWQRGEIKISVSSALANLKAAYSGSRVISIKFGFMSGVAPRQIRKVTVNGKEFLSPSKAELEKGILITLDR